MSVGIKATLDRITDNGQICWACGKNAFGVTQQHFAAHLDLVQILLEPALAASKEFRSIIYLMAAVFEPSFGITLFYNHPGDPATTKNVKQTITGYYCY